MAQLLIAISFSEETKQVAYTSSMSLPLALQIIQQLVIMDAVERAKSETEKVNSQTKQKKGKKEQEKGTEE